MRQAVFIFFIGFICQAYSQEDNSWKIFDESQLLSVELYLPADTLAWIMQNTSSDLYHTAAVHIKNSWMDTTLNNVGFRLRGNTSRNAQKKSFKISFDAFVPGRKFFDLSCLNLNGEHNDPSITRSKLCFDLMHDIGLKASHASHAMVYINGDYYGLYVDVESIDKQFIRKNFSTSDGNLWKCLYPADLVYKSDNPEDYKKIQSGGRPAYELKTNESSSDFSELARFIRIINKTNSDVFSDSLERVCEPYEFLKYFAINNLVGSWDEYWSLMNNYYLYADPSTGFMHLLPYDYDNTFGVDWFSTDWARSDPYTRQKVASGNRPLAENILKVNAYRDLYTHFLDFYNREVYDLPQWENRLTDIYNLIDPAANVDPFRTYDYGFSMQDFTNSYTSGAYVNQHVKYGLRQFINTRNSSLNEQLTWVDGEPVLYHPSWTPVNPKANDTVWVTASCYSHTGLEEVNIVFTTEGGGVVKTYSMSAVPVEKTKLVEDADRWRGAILPLGEGVSGTFRIILKDQMNRTEAYPRSGSWSLKSIPSYPQHIVINELMASNQNAVADYEGQYDDWLELYNPTGNHVMLTGMYLSDSRKNLKKWRFNQQNLELEPGGYIGIWCDADTNDTGFHTNFKLASGGEFIALTESDGQQIIDSVSFSTQQPDISYGRYPDGSVYWSIMPPSFQNSNIETRVDKGPTDVLTDFQVFPNPFRDQLNIRINHPGTGNFLVQIVALDGRILYHKLVTSSDPESWSFLIHPMLTPGVYSLRIEGIKFRMVRRIVCFR